MTSISVLFCLRYEEEVSLRATAENEFVTLKKVSTMGSGSTDTRNLRMTDGLFLERSEGVNLSVGCRTLPNQGGEFPEVMSGKVPLGL